MVETTWPISDVKLLAAPLVPSDKSLQELASEPIWGPIWLSGLTPTKEAEQQLFYPEEIWGSAPN